MPWVCASSGTSGFVGSSACSAWLCGLSSCPHRRRVTTVPECTAKPPWSETRLAWRKGSPKIITKISPLLCIPNALLGRAVPFTLFSGSEDTCQHTPFACFSLSQTFEGYLKSLFLSYLEMNHPQVLHTALLQKPTCACTAELLLVTTAEAGRALRKYLNRC